MRQSVQVLIVLVSCLLLLVLMAYWTGYHRQYVPEPNWDTEILFCHTAGDGYVELGIRSIAYPTHRVPLIRLRTENYQGVCDAWLKIEEEVDQ